MVLEAIPWDLLSLWSTSVLLQQMDTLRDLQGHLDAYVWAAELHSQFVFQGEESLSRFHCQNYWFAWCSPGALHQNLMASSNPV